MPCVDLMRRPLLARLCPLLVLAGLGSGCSPWRTPVASPLPPAASSVAASTTATPVPRTAAAGGDAAPQRLPRTMPTAPTARKPQRMARHWEDYQLLAAERLVEANPAGTYGGPVAEPLLAIPVLEIELNGDGSVRRILVKRKPTQALDTVQLAIAAVERAAPFGPVSHLPRPWKFTEVFLFNEQRRFKPRSLDL